MERPIIQKLLTPQTWMSQLVFIRCWNPVELCSNAIEGMDLLSRQEQTEKKQKLPSFMTLYKLTREGTALNKMCLSA